MIKYIISNNGEEFSHPCVVITPKRLTYWEMEVFLKSKGWNVPWNTFTIMEETDLRTFIYEGE